MDARTIFPVSGMVLAIMLLMFGGTSTADSACFSTHTFGSFATFMKICISQHGNLMRFESPFESSVGAVNHITSEGYRVCSGNPSPPPGWVLHGFDAGFSESGFGPSTITQPNGLNTFPLTIVRTTTDNIFRLTQVFSRDTTEKDVTITMTLKNISGTARSPVALSRYFDGDLASSNWNDIYDMSRDSVWGRDQNVPGNQPGHGLMLTALTFGTSHFPGVQSLSDWLPGDCPWGGNSESILPTDPDDWVGRMVYFLGTINPGQTKTVKVLYRRI